MAELVTTAVIRASDRLTGPLQAIASKVRGVQGNFAAGAAHAAHAGNKMMAGLAGAGFGIGMVLNKAEEFNKSIFGVGVASVTDAMDAAGKVDLQVPLGDMEKIQTASMGMSQKLRMSATTIANIGETFAKAGMKSDKLVDAMETTATLSKTDFETPAAKMAEFMTTLSMIHKPIEGEGFGDFMRRQGDMVLAAAAETQMSVGGVMEGLKQFQTIGAGMGMKSEEMLALLMGGARRGFNPSELGTALKSDLVRTLKPTAGGAGALALLLERVGKNRSDYFKAGAEAPERAISSLRRSVIGGISPAIAKQLKTEMMKAQQEGYGASDGFINRVTGLIAQSKGMNDMDSLGKLGNVVRGAMTSPKDGNYDFIRMLDDLVKAGATDAQLAEIFEGRQLARNKSFIEMFRVDEADRRKGIKSEFEQTMQLLQRMKGQGLDTVEQLWSKSAFGNQKAMSAAFEGMMIRLANSPAIQNFVNMLERMTMSLQTVNPELLKVGLGVAGFVMLAGPVTSAATALMFFGKAAGAALLASGRLFAIPFIAAAARMNAAALGLTMLGAAGVTGAAGLGVAASGLARLLVWTGRLAKFATIAGLAWAAFELFQNPEKFTSFFAKIGSGESMTAFTASLSELWSSTKGFAEGLDKALAALLQMFGIDAKGSMLGTSLTWILDLLTSIVQQASDVMKFLTFDRKTGPGKDPTITGLPGEVRGGSEERVPWFGFFSKILAPALMDALGSKPTYGPLQPNSEFPPPFPLSDAGEVLAPPAASLSSAGEGLGSSAAALQNAASALQSAADRLQTPNVTVSGGGGGGVKATAPALNGTNGQSYGAR